MKLNLNLSLAILVSTESKVIVEGGLFNTFSGGGGPLNGQLDQMRI